MDLCKVMARNMTGSNMIPLGSMGSPSAALKPAAGVSLLLPSYLAGSNVKQEKNDGERLLRRVVIVD